ncbi:MAG TPA: hypothetical protein VGM84_07240 [Steroidobacteraceae bacterium]|jgi:hypothetical protein
MVTKREFLAGSAAAVTAGALVRGAADQPPVTATGAAAGSAPTPDRALAMASERFDVVVYNGLFEEARDFAAAQVANGALALAVDGDDAGVLWSGTLRQLVRGGRRRVAGIGTHTDFFILETLGREERLRMAQVCRHHRNGPVPAAGSRLVSWVLEQKS